MTKTVEREQRENRYRRTGEYLISWMQEPWTCPKCGILKRQASRNSHIKWCGVPFNEAAFWDSMERLPWSGCWIWTKASLHYGYGGVQWFKTPNDKRVLTGIHRVAWMLTYGSIPKGLHVLHKCDVTACGNPEHLFLGTHADNMADRARKGRGNNGGRLRPHIHRTKEQQ